MVQDAGQQVTFPSPSSTPPHPHPPFSPSPRPHLFFPFLISFPRPLILFTFHFAFIHHMHYLLLPVFIRLDSQCFHPPLLNKYLFIYVLSRTLKRRSPSSFSLNGGVDAQDWNLPSLPLQVFPPSSPRYLVSLPRVK